MGYVSFSGCLNLQLPVTQAPHQFMKLLWQSKIHFFILPHTPLALFSNDIESELNHKRSLPGGLQRKQQLDDLKLTLLSNLHQRLIVKGWIVNYFYKAKLLKPTKKRRNVDCVFEFGCYT